VSPPIRELVTRPVPWHPVVLATVVVFNFWVQTAVSPFAAVRSLLIALVVALLLTLVIGALARSMLAGAVGASVVVALAWSKQLVLIPMRLAERGEAIPAAVIVVASLAIAVLLARLVLRRGRAISLRGITGVLNHASLLLLIATIALSVLDGRLTGAVGDLRQGIDLPAWNGSTVHAREPSRPDIYAILLDGYPRADVLDYAFSLDNSSFITALQDRGFDVAERSRSDYLWTHVSLPSALNMAYVEQIPAMQQVIEGQAARQPTLRRTVANNVVFDTAREHGYTPVAIGSGFEEVAPRQADVYVDGGQLNEFEISLMLSTWLGDMVATVTPDLGSGQQRARIRFNLDALGRIAAMRDREPALVFAHIPAPHQPVVFGEAGRPIAVPISDAFFADSPGERGEDRDEFVSRYRAQLPYLNDLVLQAVDAILANANEPPIIVIFADHGSASVVDWNTTDPVEADPARLLERTGILFAALTPGREDVFPDDISPVDIFRLLFDAYWDTDFGRAVPPPNGGQVAPVDASVLAGG
jgi:hypothetical protein